MASLLERTLGAVRKENTGGQGNNRRVSGGGAAGSARASPYARPEGDSWKHDRFGETEDGPDSSARKGGRAAAGTASSQGPSPKLVITNLHYEVSERELEVLFVQIGPIAAGPKIKFDRSGRSEGVAWVTYASEKHAAAAKEAFDGAIAKGEPIKVDFDYRIDRPLERGTPAAGSLLARVGGLSDGSSSRGPKFASPAGGRGSGPRHSAGGRAERGVGSSSGGPRGGTGRDSRDGGRGSDARGGGGGRGGRGGGGGRASKAQPKSGGDLDAELEAFMKAPSGGSGTKAAQAVPPPVAASTSAAEATSGGDVEMA